MRRRDFLSLAGAAAATSPFGRTLMAQTAKIPRVALVSGAVMPADMTATGDPQWAQVIQELARRGFVEGQTVTFDRYLGPTISGPEVARQIIEALPDVILAGGAAGTAVPLLSMTKTIPIVVTTGDPLGQGLVSNMAHPGGNVTAVASAASSDSEGKNFSLLAEAVSGAKRIAYLNSGLSGAFIATAAGYVRSAMDAATKLKLSFVPIFIESPGGEPEIRAAFQAAVAANADAVQCGFTTTSNTYASLMAQLSLDAKMPAISPFELFARSGGLMSYGSNLPDVYRQTADYVADILKGAKPGDLPVLQPELFDFIINQKTAKGMGLTFPASFLVQATEVIQ